jgi:large subunit ribosomal protein L30e
MNLNEILRKRKTIYGYRSVKKKMLKGDVELIIIAKNCPPALKRDLLNLCDTFGIKHEEFEGTTIELGTVCGRPHSISVLGVLKE